ncbi:hypothetical protein ACFYOT_27735 [Saccharothrix saharensis]|uniref:hypothetical protein n=1 Tax=Saccharothrix saharensis TaxID=571190 RepID=UPI00369D4EAA
MEVVPFLRPHTDRAAQPSIKRWGPSMAAEAAVLVLPGGRARGREPASRANLSYLRMVPFARHLSRQGPAVWLVRYR